ncbi:MAG TPA: alpha/beta hydrolase [Candidatus Goldiibacteriota bacterium]|nr:alpha/beta hydrolase [Candidatus Goldiibacteriota bacterium]HPI02345.1 alpha/beta hydrolase [Candidatus Goldiibacteriota bacterium]HPN63744.1 alpha/beta hydrolase [Candidatus Goldiibacteriota bacterium]HRQ43002.1 alpha/beta hydrolase [Candidatus Goldiibacteriota bacterium]
MKKYGNAPYKVIVIHGGPGAAGEMAPVARRLSEKTGILEPYQKQDTIKGQVDELKGCAEKYGDIPVVLIGHSWGAWLSVIFAAAYPSHVKKLILVSGGPLEEEYAADIHRARMARLTEKEKEEVKKFENEKADAGAFKRFGEIFAKADSYSPIKSNDPVKLNYEIYKKVWEEAAQLRRSGGLINFLREIQCPVTAVHGDYDPHPADGVREPLKKYVKDSKFILLERCGHTPWLEKEAVETFYSVLLNEI